MAVYQPRREAWNSSFPHSPQEAPTLPTLWFWIFSLRNCERIDFCCLSHLILVPCLAAPANDHGGLRPNKSHWAVAAAGWPTARAEMTQDHKGTGHPMRRSLECNWPGKSSCSSTLKNKFSRQQWAGHVLFFSVTTVINCLYDPVTNVIS